MKMSVDLFCSLIFTSGIFKIGNEKTFIHNKNKNLSCLFSTKYPSFRLSNVSITIRSNHGREEEK